MSAIGLGRRGRGAAVAATMLGLVLVVPGAARGAGLESFTENAEAPGVQFMVVGSGTQGPQAGTVPHAETQLSAGFGHGLAALAWPGNAAGNLGGVVAVLGLSQIPQAILAPVRQQAGSLNDPARAETKAPGGPADATYPAGSAPDSASMRSHADVGRVESWASTPSAAPAPAMSFGPIAAHSRSTVAKGVATAQGDSTVNQVSLGAVGPAALMTIDSLSSTVKVTSDGHKATQSGHTTASGVAIAGVPVTIDDHGVHVSSTGTELVAAQDTVDAAIVETGLRIVLVAPDHQLSGAKAAATSGALVIEWSQQGYVFTVTIGGASAAVQASPGLAALVPPGATLVSGDGAAFGGSLTAGPPAGGGPSSEPLSPPDTSTATSPTPSGSAASPAVGPSALAAAKNFGGLPLALVLLGLAGVALLAGASKKLPTDVLAERAVVDCPLERGEGSAT